MLEAIHFENFKALRDTTLPLSPFTLIVGPNGSGKSTVLDALKELQSVAAHGTHGNMVIKSISHPLASIHGHDPEDATRCTFRFSSSQTSELEMQSQGSIWSYDARGFETERFKEVAKIRVFEFVPKAMVGPEMLQPGQELQPNGSGLAATLDSLRDKAPERFEQLNSQLEQWLPEFDRILFETPASGQRSLLLRTTSQHHRIPASVLSQGTLIALALLTLAYMPDPPTIIGLEEPDRGLHPRLLRQLKDALYRLAYPEASDCDRKPIQIIATTHSPYFVDQFKDHPEEIVVANKKDLDVTFERLSDRPHLQEIIEGSRLGDVWYSGILGGVPTAS